jgi:hypothetical protein
MHKALVATTIYYRTRILCGMFARIFLPSYIVIPMQHMKHPYTLTIHRNTRLPIGTLSLVSMLLANCSGTAPVQPSSPAARFPTPTMAPALAPLTSPVPLTTAQVSPSAATAQPGTPVQGTVISVDANRNVHLISPLIYGLNGAPKELQQALQLTLNPWAATQVRDITGNLEMPGMPAAIISTAILIMAIPANHPAMILSLKRSTRRRQRS